MALDSLLLQPLDQPGAAAAQGRGGTAEHGEGISAKRIS